MSNLGPQWEEGEDYSPARMDAKNILRDTGTNIVAISTSRQLGAVCPTDTSGGLIKDVLYVCEYDGFLSRVRFKPVFGAHLHNANDDISGGRLADIRFATSGQLNEVYLDPIIAYWRFNTVGTPTPTLAYEDSASSAKLMIDTQNAINNNGTAWAAGPIHDFGQKLQWQAKLQMGDNSNLVVRVGMGIDRLDQTQDTARRQIGIEGCDGHGVNWVIINANGNSGSLHVQATTANLNPGVSKNYKLVEIPATECRAYENGVSIGVSTTNVASDGANTSNRLFVWGIKTTSAALVRLRLWYAQVIGLPSGSGEQT